MPSKVPSEDPREEKEEKRRRPKPAAKLRPALSARSMEASRKAFLPKAYLKVKRASRKAPPGKAEPGVSVLVEDRIQSSPQAPSGQVALDLAQLASAFLPLPPPDEPVAQPSPKQASGPATLTPGPEEMAYLSGELDLLADFTVEAREHIASIEKGLLRLEQDPQEKEAINSVFRAFHSIKGLAGFLALHQVQSLTHEVETLLEEVRTGRHAVDSALVDVVLQSADYVTRSLVCLDALVGGVQLPLPTLDPGLLELVRALQQGAGRAGTLQAPLLQPDEPVAKQLPIFRPMTSQAPAAPCEPPPPAKSAAQTRATEASRVKVDTRKLDALVEMVGELVVAQSLLSHDEHLKSEGNALVAHKVAQMARITSEVQQISMAMRMVPIGGLFQKTARLVRDLARKSGKHVELETSGEQTELDRNIVEELGDPLVHMIRNSMDHGLESPEDRAAAGKSPTGKVFLRAAHEAGVIVVEISDDGRGLDPKKLRARGIDRGLLNENSEYSEEELFALIFLPGFSTASKVTDISGRGVGMDVVKRHIQRLRGRIEIRSQLGKGTSFLLKLPLTLAIIDGLVVGVGGQRYVMPIIAIKEMFRPAAGTVTTLDGNREIVRLRDRVMPVVRLSERFGLRATNQNLEKSLLIVTETETRTFGLAVDELLGRQEVVLKNLGEVLGNVSGIAGGAILGDGRVGLILDPKGVFESAAKESRHA